MRTLNLGSTLVWILSQKELLIVTIMAASNYCSLLLCALLLCLMNVVNADFSGVQGININLSVNKTYSQCFPSFV